MLIDPNLCVLGWWAASVGLKWERVPIERKRSAGFASDRLDALFSSHEAGRIPDGEAKGRAIIAPGTRFSEPIAEIVNVFAWQERFSTARQASFAIT